MRKNADSEMLSTVFYKCQLGQVCQSLCSTLLHVNAFLFACSVNY